MKTGAILATVMILGLALGCGHKGKRQEQDGPAVKVQTMRVDLQRTPDVHEIVGTVRAKLTASVSAKVMAAIREIPVRAGAPVATGQLLAKLDDRDLRAEYDRARADFDRFTVLLEKQAVTRAEYDAVQSRYRVAEAALSYASVSAPFDGVVAQKLCDVGDMATPGKPLFTVELPTDFQLEAQVPERFAGAVAVGKSVHVVVDAAGEKCAGAVAEVEAAGDAASRSFLVKIDLQCHQVVKSGMFGRAQLLIGERPALFVTRDAVHQRGQLTYVFVVSEGRARMRLVKTGREYLGAMELLSGVQPGERVVVKAEGDLVDGARADER